MKWSFIDEHDNIVEKFEDDSEVKDSKIYTNKNKLTEQTAPKTFCEKGQMYSAAFRKCDPCPMGSYQDLTEHRNIKCKNHPNISTSKCPDGKYNALSQAEIQEKKNKINDRAISIDDLCKPHDNFSADKCKTGRYIGPQYENIRNKTKDRPLNEADYCLDQPSAASIKCPTKTYLDTDKFKAVVDAKEKQVTSNDVCTSATLQNIKTSVSETKFDKASNTRQFRTILFVGNVNWDGTISVIRTDAKNQNIAGSPHTNISVKRNVEFSVSRVEPNVGDHFYAIYFADAKGRGFVLKYGVKVHLYNFQFQLANRHHQFVRKGSNRYQRPTFKGQNYHNVTNNENTFDRNLAKVQHVTYTAGNSRGPGSLSATSKATVYNCSARVHNYHNQTVKVGANHHTLGNANFARDNMEHYKSTGYPAVHHNTNDRTFTVTHYLRDTRDHSYNIKLHTKVRKYRFTRTTFKNVSADKGQTWGWHHMVSAWGTNSQVIHAQRNVHPWTGVHHNNDSLKNSVGSHGIRFYTRNGVTHGEGAWSYATAHVINPSRTFYFKERWHTAHSFYGPNYNYRKYYFKDENGHQTSYTTPWHNHYEYQKMRHYNIGAMTGHVYFRRSHYSKNTDLTNSQRWHYCYVFRVWLEENGSYTEIGDDYNWYRITADPTESTASYSIQWFNRYICSDD